MKRIFLILLLCLVLCSCGTTAENVDNRKVPSTRISTREAGSDTLGNSNALETNDVQENNDSLEESNSSNNDTAGVEVQGTETPRDDEILSKVK